MLSFGRPTGLAVGRALKDLRLPRVHRGISPWDLLGPPFRRFEFSGLGVAQYTQNTPKGRKSYVNMGFALASQRRTRAGRPPARPLNPRSLMPAAPNSDHGLLRRCARSPQTATRPGRGALARHVKRREHPYDRVARGRRAQRSVRAPGAHAEPNKRRTRSGRGDSPLLDYCNGRSGNRRTLFAAQQRKSVTIQRLSVRSCSITTDRPDGRAAAHRDSDGLRGDRRAAAQNDVLDHRDRS
jgi:hypothetical protein